MILTLLTQVYGYQFKYGGIDERTGGKIVWYLRRDDNAIWTHYPNGVALYCSLKESGELRTDISAENYRTKVGQWVIRKGGKDGAAGYEVKYSNTLRIRICTKQERRERSKLLTFLQMKLRSHRKDDRRRGRPRVLDNVGVQQMLNFYDRQLGLDYYTQVPLFFAVRTPFALSIERLDERKTIILLLDQVALCCSEFNFSPSLAVSRFIEGEEDVRARYTAVRVAYLFGHLPPELYDLCIQQPKNAFVPGLLSPHSPLPKLADDPPNGFHRSPSSNPTDLTILDFFERDDEEDDI